MRELLSVAEIQARILKDPYSWWVAGIRPFATIAYIITGPLIDHGVTSHTTESGGIIWVADITLPYNEYSCDDRTLAMLHKGGNRHTSDRTVAQETYNIWRKQIEDFYPPMSLIDTRTFEALQRGCCPQRLLYPEGNYPS